MLRKFSFIAIVGLTLITTPIFADEYGVTPQFDQARQKMEQDMQTIKADQMKLQQDRNQLNKDRAEMMRIRQDS